ncbi:MAG: type II toxin-antitoxin system VapC family toxin [Candidatus Bathyarchaeia archaeon]
MNGQTAYLDSSAIVKRYIEEAGTDKVRELYVKTYTGDVKLAFSTWNIGEVLGVLDRAKYLNRISEEDYNTARRFFLLRNLASAKEWNIKPETAFTPL